MVIVANARVAANPMFNARELANEDATKKSERGRATSTSKIHTNLSFHLVCGSAFIFVSTIDLCFAPWRSHVSRFQSPSSFS